MNLPDTEVLALLRKVMERPGAQIRLYHIEGGSSEAWQGSVTWDTHAGINTGFKVGVRHDPVESLVSVCQQVLDFSVSDISTAQSPHPPSVEIDIDDLLG